MKWNPQQEYTSHWISLYFVSPESVLKDFQHAAKPATGHLLMHIWQHLVGPLFCSLLFYLSPRRGQSQGPEGSYLHNVAVPSFPNFCCPCLWNLDLMHNGRMVIHVQQVPVPWKPPFCPQNIPFYPFWRPVTRQSRHHTTPGKAMTKPIFCFASWLIKKDFLVKPC